MNRKTKAWDRLVAAARRAPAEADEAAPYGFAARVAALGLSARPEKAAFFGPFSLRVSLPALGVACLLALATAGAGYPALMRALASPAPEAAAPAEAELASPPAAAPAAAPASNPAPSDDPVADVEDIVS